MADASIEFAMIRVGYRGYGSEGKMMGTPLFPEQYSRVRWTRGLKVGVYYFSQAVTVEEAREGGGLCAGADRPYPISYPVVFDWERQNYSGSRTQKIPDTETMCRMANAFCEEIQTEGYQPMVYFYQNLAYNNYDLSKIMEHPLLAGPVHRLSLLLL